MSKVFISYSHDSPEHEELVLQFANALRAHGIDAELDRYHVRPPQGWRQWCEEQLRPEVSSHVLMICTETYLRRVEGKVAIEVGRGVFHESHIIQNYLYDEKVNERFIPVLLDGATSEHIPIRIRNHGRYAISKFDITDAEYKALCHDLTGRPAITKPDLGTLVPLEARPVQTTFAPIAPSRLPSSALLIGRDDEVKALDAAWSDNKSHVVTIVAWGGVGKSTLAAHWAATKYDDVERYFDWSFYRQGSSDVFVKTALEFFGDAALAASAADGWQKGERLAQLIAPHRTLLILDGLEPLQDAKTGELRDPALKSLLRGLAARNRGLCVITTRQETPDLDTFRKTTAPQWKLARLSKEAGASLLERLGVNGTATECETLAADVKGHALTLTLLGKFLAEAHGGDIRRRDLVSLHEADDEETSGHAFRVMEAYEEWLRRDGRVVELAILRLLGLFDRPATPDCLAALREPPAIVGFSDSLVTLSDAQWNLAVTRLVQLGFVEAQPWEPPNIAGYGEEEARRVKAKQIAPADASPLQIADGRPMAGIALDAHPLIREYFGGQLRRTAAWREAHSRLYEHLISSVPYWPEGIDGLQPLYQAVVHGCYSGRYEEAHSEVYRDRIVRGTSGSYAFYSTKLLGAVGADLAAISCFFVLRWTELAPELPKSTQSWLQGQAAFRLRALGRLDEARDLTRAALEFFTAEKEWTNAAIAAGNLSELDLMLGDVTSAV
ncbi:MAG TPA: TIR domain-containing protein, partial [Thermoanaerobaculia bacterium]|nr:TIR domain-containing protein [Thermoanaerobaculia bacterium]